MSNATNFNAYEAKMRENINRVYVAANQIINYTIKEMYKKVVDRTPLGNPSLWKYPAPPNYTPGQLKAGWKIKYSNGDEIKLTSSTDSQTVTISNDVVYGPRVEYGSWSTQAPQGMMRITITEYTAILNQKTAQYGIKSSWA